jgi:hypothetical protein
MMWHVDPLLGNDSKIRNHTTAVTRHQSVNSNRGTVFSVTTAVTRHQPVNSNRARCFLCGPRRRYKQGQSAVGVNDRTALVQSV